MAIDKLELELPIADLDQLHKLSDKRAPKVSVDREKLRMLLMDHTRALGYLQTHGLGYVTKIKRTELKGT